MKNPNLVRGVANACRIIFSLLKVISIIGGVCMMILVLSLSFLPNKAVTVTAYEKIDIALNMKEAYGEAWTSSLEEVVTGEEVSITEDGVFTSQSETTELDNRTLAISMLPSLVQIFLGAILFTFASKAAKALHEASFTPFTPELADNVKKSALALFVQAGAPLVISPLVTLFTGGKALMESNLDLGSILLAFILLAAAEMLSYAATLAPFPMGDAPFGQNPEGTQPPFTASEPEKEEEKPSDKDDSFHPGAF